MHMLPMAQLMPDDTHHLILTQPRNERIIEHNPLITPKAIEIGVGM